jgi:hypothetical protein
MLGLDISSESGSGGGTSSIYSVENVPDNKFWESKVKEFQILLNKLGDAREGMIGLVDYGPAEIQPELTALLDELDGKIGVYKTTANALNLAIEAYNAAKLGPLPKLNTTTLGAVPVQIIALTAAIGAAGALIYWGSTWLTHAKELSDRAQLYGYLSPAAREQVALNQLKIRQAAEATAVSPLTSISNIAKWVSIAAVAYFAYQAFQKMR